jgi:hypothetical protein
MMNTRSRGQHPPSDDTTPTVFQENRDQLTAILHCLDGFDHRMSTFESDRSSFQDCLASLTTQLDNGIIHLEDTQQRLSSLEHDSSPSNNLTSDAIEHLINDKLRESYGPTLASISSLSASIAELALHQQPQSIDSTISPSSRPHGFFQKESKDFHVSRLLKLLDTEVLQSDSLQDLELFFDSILSHFNTVALTSDLYPKYRDLTPTFDFYRHLCQLDRTIHPSATDQHQGLANFMSFGIRLRRFMLNPKTIPQEKCPDSYLQLLSLHNESDGFTILKNFTFLHSPLDTATFDLQLIISLFMMVNI